MRDSVSFWVSDDRGEIGLPRVGIEAVAEHWEEHGLQMNVAFPDGRVYRLRADGQGLARPGRPRAAAAVLGRRAARLPLRGAVRHLDDDLRRARPCRPRRPTSSKARRTARWSTCEFHVEATMAVPPWIQGSLLPEAATRLEGSVEGDLMGGPRYEQLFRATGSVRTRRRASTNSPAAVCASAARACAGWPGSGVTAGSRRSFPVGGRSATSPTRRAPTASPPSTRATSSRRRRADPGPGRAGTVADQAAGAGPGRLAGAWRRRDGVAKSKARPSCPPGTSPTTTTWAMQAIRQEMPDFPPLQQAGVRYRWDGEETYGMLERSYPLDKTVAAERNSKDLWASHSRGRWRWSPARRGDKAAPSRAAQPRGRRHHRC